jgi:hypothetical protein
VFSRIGQDEREVLEYVPSSFKVIRHIRPVAPVGDVRAQQEVRKYPSGESRVFPHRTAQSLR